MILSANCAALYVSSVPSCTGEYHIISVLKADSLPRPPRTPVQKRAQTASYRKIHNNEQRYCAPAWVFFKRDGPRRHLPRARPGRKPVPLTMSTAEDGGPKAGDKRPLEADSATCDPEAAPATADDEGAGWHTAGSAAVVPPGQACVASYRPAAGRPAAAGRYGRL